MATTVDLDANEAAPLLPRDKKSTTDLVKAQLLEWIEDGRYKPGDALPSERELQATFNVSRVSVREAMVSLEAVGLVEIEHGRGCYVSRGVAELVRKPFAVWMKVNRDEIVGLLKVRSALDGLAAYEAADHGDQQDLDRVVAAHEAFAHAVKNDVEAVQLTSLDKKFHFSIAVASRLKITQDLLTTLDHNVVNSHRRTMAMDGRPPESVKEHARIVNALLDGNSARAQKAAADHVKSSIELVRRYVDLDNS